MSKINDINQLRDELIEAYDTVKRDPRRANQVKEQVNAAGKILGTLKAQMEYAMMRGEEPDIPFMGKTTGKPLKAGAKLIAA